MPVRRSRLSRAEEEKTLVCLQQMQAAGVDVEIPEGWLQRARALEIFVIGGLETMIFSLPDGRAGYAIRVRLVGLRRVTLLDCEIGTRWDDQIVLNGLLDDRDSRNPRYRLGPLEYPLRQVLNLRIENSLRFHGRGQMIEGVILASGLKPIPEAYGHGLMVPFMLTFLDQSENEIRHNGELYVDRTFKAKPKPKHRGSGLYGPVEGVDPDFRANINRGKVPDLMPRSPEKDAEADEAIALLRKAVRQLRPH